MTKTGKLALSLGICVPAAIVGTTAVAVVCLKNNPEEQGIDPQIKCGGNVFNITHTKITIGNSFKVRINDNVVGYEKVDQANTQIKIDGKEVRFKTLSDKKTIEVDGKDVTSTNISININALATVSKVTYKWNKDFLEGVEWPCFVVGQTMTAGDETTDLTIEALFGNEKHGKWIKLTPGKTGDDHYQIYKTRYNLGLFDITDDFVNKGGYKFTEEDIKKTSTGKELPYRTSIVINYSSDTYGASAILDSLVGKKVEKIEIDPDYDKTVECGKTTWYNSVVTPTSAIPYDKFEIVSDGGTGSRIHPSGFFTAGDTAGIVTIKITSLHDPNKTNEFKVEVK